MSFELRVAGSGLDRRYMYQALALSLRAAPWPNPRVGAVLVKDGKIIIKQADLEQVSDLF